MNKPIFPDRGDIDSWVSYLTDDKEDEFKRTMKPHLPIIDEGWKKGVADAIELTQLNTSLGGDLHRCAASIFYKIVKRHSYIDGNKRSAIIATYLYYFVNDHFLFPPGDLRKMAKRIARSKGSRQESNWLKKLEKFFFERAIKF
jgi:death-on-curing family protein